MKRLLLATAAGALLGGPLFGYSYYFSDPLTSAQPASWYQNGDVRYDSTGLWSNGAGALVSQTAVPDGTSEYEVKATLRGTAPNGYSDSFRILLHASSDANGSGTGTSYSIVVYPEYSTFYIYKTVAGTVTQINSGSFPYYDGITIRAVIRADGEILTYYNNVFFSWTRDTDIASGKPGIAMTGNGLGVAYLHLSNVYLGPLDRVAPTIPAGLPSVSVYSNHVDFQWAGVYDDASGVGIGLYQFYKDFNFLANTSATTFTDWAVTPGNIYTYTFIVYDMHWNATQVSFAVNVPVSPGSPPAPPDGRRIGIRPTGTYWGAGGENIDVLSGNVNFTIPLLKAQSRGGKSMSFAMNYNSQNWRQDSGGIWNLGYDAGIGFGWRIMAGSIQQIWDGYFNIWAYKFTDSTGAEYMLNLQDPNNSDLWRSRESIHLVYQASNGLLWFPDGTFWEFGCTSNLHEPDAGVRYPTRQEDSNGNQIWIRYLAGQYYGGNNSSSRISQIEDVRAPGGNGGTTYSFNYDFSSWPPRLLSLTNSVGTPESYTFGFTTGSLQAPFSPYSSYGNTTFMWEMAQADGSRYQFANNGYGEIYDVMFPTGGHVAWNYQNVAYLNGRTYREAYQRILNDVANYYVYTISHGSVGTNMRPWTTIDDAGGVGQKYWSFSQSGANASMLTQYQGRSSGVAKTQDDISWTQDTDGNLYVGSTTNTLDPPLDPLSPATKKKTDQTVDVNGNLTKLLQYNYGNLTSPARIYTYNYVTASNYLAWHMTGLLSSATLGGGINTTITLVTNTYDTTNPSAALSPRANQFETSWGVNNGALVRNERGNVSSSTTPAGTRQANYDETGTATQITVNGVTTQVSTTSTTNSVYTNYTVPAQITAAGIATTMSYNTFLGLTNESSANGYSMGFGFDSLGRPSSVTSPFGATTSTAVNAGPHLINQTLPVITTTTTTANGRWTKTTADWYGRPALVETGDASGTKSQVDTVYGPCGCTPLGKMVMQSMPHAVGATKYWTKYTYDGIGRTLSVQAADAASTTYYSYSGNMVTVTDPALKSKTYTVDAFGHLTQVNEPNPAGGADYVTTYTYDLMEHLIGVSMPRTTGTQTWPQTRTFNYSGTFLMSATNPENGTVSYTYNTSGNQKIATKTDAKGQQTQYSYDSYARLTEVRHYISGTEDTCQRVDYYYDSDQSLDNFSQNVSGRLAAVQYKAATGVYGSCDTTFKEMYSYNSGGARIGKRLAVTRAGVTNAANLDGNYTYDNEGKMLTQQYPSWWNGSSTVAGPALTYTYDTMGRLSGLTENGSNSIILSSATAYGPAGELQAMSGSWGSESRGYNAMLQMTFLSSGSVSMAYNYSLNQNNGKITSQYDYVSGEAVTYAYDSLNRLASAGASSWAQSYTYDGFGNLTDISTTLGTTPEWHVAYSAATNRVSNEYADANGNIGNGSYDVENRLLAPTWINNTTRYAYAPDNKRVWRGVWQVGPGAQTVDEITFWSVTGQRVGTYSLIPFSDSSTLRAQQTGTEYYFGGKLVKNAGGYVHADRLGSIGKYYPYGQERPSATANGTEKFGTYFRDADTGLDYADQRYHAPGQGRFLSPDRLGGGVSEPGSWNKYAYTRGDPVNRTDANGMCDSDFCITATGYLDDPSSDPNAAFGSGPAFGNGRFANPGIDLGTGDAGQFVELPMQGPSTGQAAKTQAIIDRYVSGLNSLKSFSTKSKDCLKDLTAVGLTSAQVDSLAAGAKFLDYSALPAQTRLNLISRLATLAADSNTQTIYYIPVDLVSESYQLQLGDLLHELIHLSGFGGTGSDQDTNLQRALGLTTDPNYTGNISDKLAKDCFKGAKAP